MGFFCWYIVKQGTIQISKFKKIIKKKKKKKKAPDKSSAFFIYNFSTIN